MTKLSASLFTGGGLWDIGAMQAGLTPVWGVEIVPEIADVAERNIPGLSVIRSDVAAVDYASLPKVYHLHMSPKCTNVSQANSGAGETEEDVAQAQAGCRAIREVLPVAVTLENVWQYQNPDYQSFKLIVRTLHELGYAFNYWHLNSADYAVPQTRKRLILIARRDGQPVTMPQPTHAKTPLPQLDLFGGEFGLKRWVGWYSAIKDLLPGLPIATRAGCELCEAGLCGGHFAPWQEERLPDELKSMLLVQGGYDGEVVRRDVNEPAFTMTANSNQSGVKALLIGGGNTNKTVIDSTYRNGDQPTYTVTQSSDRDKAFVVDQLNYHKDGSRDNTVRLANEPIWTIPVHSVKHPEPRAFVVGSQYGRFADVKDRGPQARLAAQPYFAVTVSGSGHNDQRAFVGRIVKMTPRALARFQSVPDSYVLPDSNGLACTIIGNGVPVLLAKAICESLE